MSYLAAKFTKWSIDMQYYRLPILVAIILIQGCFVAPLVLLTMPPQDMLQMAVITFSTFFIIVLNLADIPTEITLKSFVATTAVASTMVAYNLIF